MLYKKKKGWKKFTKSRNIFFTLAYSRQTACGYANDLKERGNILLSCKIHGRDNDINRCLRSH